MQDYDLFLILIRVLTTGTIMSIEKQEREVPALQSILQKYTNRKYIGVFNSVTGAIHGALWGQGLEFGSVAKFAQPQTFEKKFVSWLGIHIEEAQAEEAAYALFHLRYDAIAEKQEQLRKSSHNVLVLDFSEFGFGPSACIATNDESAWQKAERLKIFGAFDLRTMWTQQESCPKWEPAIQLNYRLSPLVAACIRAALLRSIPCSR